MSNLSTNEISKTSDSPDYMAVSLCISSAQLLPETITRIVGMGPTYTRTLGSRTHTGMMRRPEFELNEWQLREQTNITRSEDIGKLSKQFIGQFLIRIKEAAPKVRELSKDQDVLIQIVYSVHSIPYVGLTSEHIQQIASLGARLDYDLMVDD